VVWLVLRSPYTSHHFKLCSERRWLTFDRHQRFGWDIVKRCETRDEAAHVVDEVRAVAEKAKKGERTSQRVRGGTEKLPPSK
jgi:hypothetical protein